MKQKQLERVDFEKSFIDTLSFEVISHPFLRCRVSGGGNCCSLGKTVSLFPSAAQDGAPDAGTTQICD